MSRRISNKARYVAALKDVERLMSAKRGTLQGRKLDALVNLVQAYEKRVYGRLFA